MARIIKSISKAGNDEPRDVQRPASFAFPDWTRRAEEQLEAARQQAEQLIAQARAEAEQIRETARQEGLAEGQQRAANIARQVAEQQLTTLMPSLRQFVQQLRAARGDWLRQWEHGLLQLASEIGKALAGRELAQAPEITLDWIREALELVSGPARVAIRLHPHDRAAVEPHIAALQSCLHPEAELVIVDDASVEQGGSIVQTDFGEIDQQLTARTNRILEELLS